MTFAAVPRFPPERPLAIAHRGDSAHAPENTMAAFEAAVSAGADMIELDVTLSRDGRLVVIHDDTLDRTTDGSGPVSALTLAELRALDAGAWFAPAFAGQRLPALEEVLETFGRRVLVNIEIKPEAARVPSPEPVAAMVAALVRDMGLARRVLVSSFDFQVLLDVRSAGPDLHPDLPLGVLCRALHPGVDQAALMRAVSAASWHCRDDLLDPALVAAAHGQGALVLSWAPAERNHAPAMRRALDMGADGFFANDPGVLIAELARRGNIGGP